MLSLTGTFVIYPGGRWLLALIASLGFFSFSTTVFGLDYLFWGATLFFCFLVMVTRLFDISGFNWFSVVFAVAMAILVVVDTRLAGQDIGGGPAAHEWIYVAAVLAVAFGSVLVKGFHAAFVAE